MKFPTLIRFTLAMVLGGMMVASQSLYAQTFSVIHNFTGGPDGGEPVTGLTIAGAGSFYGTARTGGETNNGCEGSCGLVFTMSHRGEAWVVTPLYTFQGGTDGGNPFAAVVIGPDGRLYGSTENGGGGDCTGFASGCGTVYAISPAAHPSANALASGTEDVLYRFAGGYDGADPFGALAIDQAGNIFGTTQIGGSSTHCFPAGCGTAYELSYSGNSWDKTILWSFGDGFDGVEPFNGLEFDPAGNLFGTTFTGGMYEEGTVFELTHSGLDWTETVLYSFSGGTDGGLPYTSITPDQSGNLFGAASDSGSGGGGTIFELTRSGAGWGFNLLYSLGDPAESECGPFGSLVMDSAGNLYGTTRCDGANHMGSVFKLSPSENGWTYSTLHDFNGSDGAYPYCNLTFDANGNLYGTASEGGAFNAGVVWEITPS